VTTCNSNFHRISAVTCLDMRLTNRLFSAIVYLIRAINRATKTNNYNPLVTVILSTRMIFWLRYQWIREPFRYIPLRNRQHRYQYILCLFILLRNPLSFFLELNKHYDSYIRINDTFFCLWNFLLLYFFIINHILRNILSCPKLKITLTTNIFRQLIKYN
jgi:hypothetical protein